MKTVKVHVWVAEALHGSDRRLLHLARDDSDRYRLGHGSVISRRWLNVQSGHSKPT